jgi:hypothetical protein
VDETTYRTTPRRTLLVLPSATCVLLNGGVLCIQTSWRHPRRSRWVIPNRWLSVLRPVGLRSKTRGRGPAAPKRGACFAALQESGHPGSARAGMAGVDLSPSCQSRRVKGKAGGTSLLPPTLRSWPLGRRSGRFPPLPYPPPRPSAMIASAPPRATARWRPAYCEWDLLLDHEGQASSSTSGSGNRWETSTGPPWQRLRWADPPRPAAREMCAEIFPRFLHRGLDTNRFIGGFVFFPVRNLVIHHESSPRRARSRASEIQTAQTASALFRPRPLPPGGEKIPPITAG